MDLLQRLFYTALGAASLFYFIVKISLSHWKNRGILHEKPKFLWGNLKGVGQKRHIATALAEIYEKYKGKAPFIGFYAFLKPMVLVLDLDVVEHILSKDAAYFTERGLYQDNDPLSSNLVQMDGSECPHLREKLKPIFDSGKMQLLLPTLLRVAETFRRSLDKEQRMEEIFSINDLVDSYNVDVISALAFGLEGNSLQYPDTEFRSMTRCYLKNFNLLKAYLALNFPHLARLVQYKSYDQVASEYFRKLVNERLEERKSNRLPPQKYTDFLQLFAELKRLRNPNERLTNEQVAAQAFSFVLAGLEACNSTLIFCLYELSLQPEIQEKARKEIESVLKRHNDQLNGNSLKELQFVKQVLKETLRKHSPYPFLMRNTIKNYEVPNSVFMLKQDNHVIIPISAIHHDPNLFAQPETFDPDRFEPTAAIEQRHRMSWLPFGLGPRHCIASEFVQMQLLVGLVTLLRHYKFSKCSETGSPPPLQYDNTKWILSPKSDIRLRLERA